MIAANVTLYGSIITTWHKWPDCVVRYKMTLIIYFLEEKYHNEFENTYDKIHDLLKWLVGNFWDFNI